MEELPSVNLTPGTLRKDQLLWIFAGEDREPAVHVMLEGKQEME
jgi:hypothetical protein